MYYMHIFLHTFYMYEYLITVFFALALVKCKMCLQFSIIQSFVSMLVMHSFVVVKWVMTTIRYVLVIAVHQLCGNSALVYH